MSNRRYFRWWVTAIVMTLLWAPFVPAMACQPHQSQINDIATIVAVPGVVGDDELTAMQCLSKFGYSPKRGGEESSSAPAGTVTRTDPPEATPTHNAGSHGPVVTYWIASEPRVVDVVGDPVSLASRKLKQAGFQLGNVERRPSPEANGTVLTQSPEAGSVAPAGTAVDVEVAVPYPQVPDVIGRSADAATGLIEQNFRAQLAGRRPSAKTADTVLQTDPEAGTRAAPGSDVSYWVASGQNAIPDIRGQHRDAAQQTLLTAGFSLGQQQQRADLGEPGRVLEQQPTAGTLADVGSAVAVWVSSELRVPELVGVQSDVAQAQLKALGLLAQLDAEEPSPKPRGEITATEPVAGTRVVEGATVHYRMTSGLNQIPDVTRGTVDDAAAKLQAAGFVRGQMTARPDSGPQGIVVEQTPVARTLRPVGEAIALVVTSELPIVPDVIGKTQVDAERLIRAATFAPAFAAEGDSPSPRGVVLRTAPPAGEALLPQTEVRYWTASGSNTVPDLTGMSHAQADQALKSAGFGLGAVTMTYAPERDGTVVRQHASGRLALGGVVAVDIGSKVRIVPSLVGKSVEEARNDVARAGLTLSSVHNKVQLSENGTVLEQSPLANTEVASDDSSGVTITVAKGIPPPVLWGTLLLAAVAGGWWTRLRPWPWNWPPSIAMRARLETADATWQPTSPLDYDPSTDVRLRVSIDYGETEFDGPLPILRTEVRHD